MLGWFQPQETRDEILRRGVIPNVHRGIEIGALNNPIVRPEEGQIEFVDYGPTHVLKAQHAHLPERVAGIVDVTHVWTGSGSLADIVGGAERFDYAIASHVIEHVPNVLGWFRGIHEVLKPGAVFNLAVPDRRYTFDVLRHESTIGELVEADFLNYTAPSVRQMFDSCALMVAIDPGAIWTNPVDPETLPPFMGDIALPLALAQAKAIRNESRYFDSHCWVFTPKSLAALLHGATMLDLFPFVVEDILPTYPGQFEFFIRLRKAATVEDHRPQDRLTALTAITTALERHQRSSRLAAM